MGSLVARVRSAKSPLFASRERILAMHGSKRLSGALMSASVNAIAPAIAGDAAVGYHAVDALVVGSNPILTAMAIRQCRRKVDSIGLALLDHDDNWPYDLAAWERCVDLIEAVVGKFDCTGSPIVRLRSLIRNIVEDGLAATLILPIVDVSLASVQPESEGLVYVRNRPLSVPRDPVQAELLAELRSACRAAPKLDVPRGSRPTAIFAKHVVLTSRIEGFGSTRSEVNSDGVRQILWDVPFVHPLGSARVDPADGEQMTNALIEDCILLRSLDFLSGGPSSHKALPHP